MHNVGNLHFLEIGSYEGRSACWFLEHILTHPSAKITCIDLFKTIDILVKMLEEEGIQHINTYEENFDWNIRAIGAENKVIKMKGRSQEILRTLPLNHYDCIYIDGSHDAHHVLEDAVLCWPLLKEGGILIFDDYLLENYAQEGHNPRCAIDAFFSVYKDFCIELHKSWQVIVQKTPLQVNRIANPNLMNLIRDTLERNSDATQHDALVTSYEE